MQVPQVDGVTAHRKVPGATAHRKAHRATAHRKVPVGEVAARDLPGPGEAA
ncbi:hypothetical protein ACH4ZX_20620 [Streptomyces sp. NPDC020490]|uniref:hypothetical protein n=1 Tax=Streptomyces sp. NPDC020490 TaxID=3365078 RepID=UPI003789F567